MGEKILTQLAGGAAPDLVYFNGTPLPLYASQSSSFLWTTMPSATPEPLCRTISSPARCRTCRWTARSSWLPLLLRPLNDHFYNKTLFDQLGVPYPSTFAEGYEDGSDKWTWDNLLVLAQQLVSGDGVDKTWALTSPPARLA